MRAGALLFVAGVAVLAACDETFDDCPDGACRGGAAGASTAAGAAGASTAGAAGGPLAGQSGSGGAAAPTCTWGATSLGFSLGSRPDGARTFVGEIRVEPWGGGARVFAATSAGLEVIDDVGSFATPHLAAPLWSDRRSDGARVVGASGAKIVVVSVPDGASTGAATSLATLDKTPLGTSGAFGASRVVDDGVGGVDLAALRAYPAVSELRLAHVSSLPVDGAVLAMGPAATPLAPTGLVRTGTATHVFTRGVQWIDHGGSVSMRAAPSGLELWAAPSPSGMTVAAVSAASGTVRLGEVGAADAETFDAGALPLAGWMIAVGQVPLAATEVRQGIVGAFGPKPGDASRLAGFLARPGTVLFVPDLETSASGVLRGAFAVLSSGRVLVAWVERVQGATTFDVLYRATLDCP